jgi:hypothetical protein
MEREQVRERLKEGARVLHIDECSNAWARGGGLARTHEYHATLGPETVSHAELQLIQNVKEMTNTTAKILLKLYFSSINNSLISSNWLVVYLTKL